MQFRCLQSRWHFPIISIHCSQLTHDSRNIHSSLILLKTRFRGLGLPTNLWIFQLSWRQRQQRSLLQSRDPRHQQHHSSQEHPKEWPLLAERRQLIHSFAKNHQLADNSQVHPLYRKAFWNSWVDLCIFWSGI